jgi:beta-mannosidase
VLLAVDDNGSRLRLHVTNDTVAPWAGVVHWSLETLDGARLDSGVAPVTVGKLASVLVQDLDFSAVITDENRRSVVLVSELHQDGAVLHRAVTPFAPSRHLALTDPGLTVDTQSGEGQLTIHLAARTLARFVALSLDGADVIFSDNYFDLPAARPVQITCPLPTGWTPAQAQAALQVRSLFDSY